jgi:hypothetical protein
MRGVVLDLLATSGMTPEDIERRIQNRRMRKT